MKIYLAGPDVFLPDAVDIGRRKVELCARHGLMMNHALDLHGCALVTPRQKPTDMQDLSAFETCVRMAAERLAASHPRTPG